MSTETEGRTRQKTITVKACAVHGCEEDCSEYAVLCVTHCCRFMSNPAYAALRCAERVAEMAWAVEQGMAGGK